MSGNMSAGQIIGGVVGGVVGAVVTSSPQGAMIGFALGSGVGSIVDPPEMEQPNKPLPGELDINLSSEGVCAPILFGTAKLNEYMLIYFAEESKEQKESAGGKGGGGDVTTGYKYYLSWAGCYALGPVDVIRTILRNKEIVWSGETFRDISTDDYVVIPELKNMEGGCRVYFGGKNHTVDDMKPGLGFVDFIDDPQYNIPYNNYFWIFYDHRLIGQTNRKPSMYVIASAYPSNSFHPQCRIGKYDYNPAHAIYRLMTLNDMLGFPADRIDTTTFANVAEELRIEERGISLVFDGSDGESHLKRLLSHIDGFLYYTRGGKWGLKLKRKNYTVGDLPILYENELASPPVITRKSNALLPSEVKVQFTNIYVRTDHLDEDSSCNAETLELVNDIESEHKLYSVDVLEVVDNSNFKVRKSDISLSNAETAYHDGGSATIGGVDTSNDDYDILTTSSILSNVEVGDVIVIETNLDPYLENTTEGVFHIVTDDDCGPYTLQRVGGKTLGDLDDIGESDWVTVGTVDKNFAHTIEKSVCEGELVRVVNSFGVKSDPVEVGSVSEDVVLDDDFITADSDDSVTISWTGGVGPFTASVSGTGYEFAFSETDIRQNTLHMGCGTGTFEITDACGEVVAGTAFSNDGAWLHVSYQYAKYAYGIRTCCWCTSSGGSTGCWKLQSRFHGSQDCNVPYYYFSDCMDRLSDYGENPCDKSTPTYYCGTYCGCPPDDSDPCDNPGGFGKSWEQMLCVWGCTDAGSHCPDSPTITDCPTRAGFG